MSEKREWKTELAKADLTQRQVAEFLKIDTSSMSLLVRKMIEGRGLLASHTDLERWERAQEYVRFKQSELEKEV